MESKPQRLSRSIPVWEPVLNVLDVGTLAVTGAAVVWLLSIFANRPDFWPLSDIWWMVLLISALIYPIVVRVVGANQNIWAAESGDFIRRRVLAWGGVILLLVLVLFLAKVGAQISRLWILGWLVVGSFALTLESIAFARALGYLRARGVGRRRILLVGGGELATRVYDQLLMRPWSGIEVAGYLSDEEQAIDGLPRLGGIGELESASESNAIDEVWIALPVSAYDKIRDSLQAVREHLINVRLIPDVFMFEMLNRELEFLGGIPVIGLNINPQIGIDAVIKRAMDILGALVVIVLFSVPALLIAIAIRQNSPGGVIYRQPRHGKGGKVFDTLKFRTMYVNSDSGSTYQQATKGDPRITAVGRFLRRTSLDELPQIINVLRGEMSLVGPRPHPVGMNKANWDDIDRYALRHSVMPGITGWAQVNGLRGETKDPELLRRRIEYDLFYIESWSLWLDIRILLKTLIVGFYHPNAY